MATTLQSLAAWAAHLRPQDIPARVLEKARWQQASVLAASFAGLFDPGARKVVESTREHGGDGRCRVIAGGFHTSRAAAVVANASVSCTFDYDEILLLGHPGHSSVTVPLVLAEELKLTWGEAVTAQVAANEIAGRLGFSTVLGPQNGQMLPFLHCASAAVAAGRLLNLNEKQLAHALAVALSQPPAALWPAFLGPIESKVLVAAHGANMGVMAAQLAARGFEGPLDLLDHPRGFFHRFSFAPLRGVLTGLGGAWLTDTLQVKLHAVCWYHQALVDGICAALADHAQGRPLVASDIRSVECGVTFLAAAVDAAENATPHHRLTANEVNFSISTAVAWTLLHGRLQPEDLTADRLSSSEAEVRALASRVRVRHDPQLTGRLLSTMHRALDLGALLGDVSLPALLGAGRALRHEFPHTPGITARDLAALAVAAPGLVRALRPGVASAEYNMAHHSVESLVLPIPATFEIHLQDGQVLRGRHDVPNGALSLPAAAVRVEEKLQRAARHVLGVEGGQRLTQRLKTLSPGDPMDLFQA